MLLEQGDFVSIIGPSGSGKSTLMHLIAGQLKPSEGSICVEPQGDLSISNQFQVGYVMQEHTLLPNLTVIQNIYLPYYLSKSKKSLKWDGNDLLNYIGLSDMKDSYPAQLSGGEVRRVAIARALITSPSVILADEPTSNLDSENATKIIHMLKKINEEGTTVMVSTHDMEFLSYSNKIYQMTKGVVESQPVMKSKHRIYNES
jgi:ABC-type lipoprotein export system ATPase subunit